ncbi:hypothetical protein TNCV_2738171 [Trichonephila clavipes]|nr:hypothetical protein TNCV_2738171 [Trichonephila clavipes]
MLYDMGRIDHLIETSAHAPQRAMVTYTGMGRVSGVLHKTEKHGKGSMRQKSLGTSALTEKIRQRPEEAPFVLEPVPKIHDDRNIPDENKMQYLVASVEPKSKAERQIVIPHGPGVSSLHLRDLDL